MFIAVGVAATVSIIRIFQDQVKLSSHPTRHDGVGRSEAQKKMRAIQDIGKRAGPSASPVIHGITAKDVDGHCKTHPV
jgi:hypothetical protein